jgi:hypothetical protein
MTLDVRAASPIVPKNMRTDWQRAINAANWPSSARALPNLRALLSADYPKRAESVNRCLVRYGPPPETRKGAAIGLGGGGYFVIHHGVELILKSRSLPLSWA